MGRDCGNIRTVEGKAENKLMGCESWEIGTTVNDDGHGERRNGENGMRIWRKCQWGLIGRREMPKRQKHKRRSLTI
jgi:hypothetical protein